MLHVFVMLAVFLAISACAAVAFVLWIVTNVTSFIGRLFGNPPAQSVNRPVQGGQVCAVPNCRSVNPADAHYCRRCGHAFGVVMMMPAPPRRMMRRRRRLHRLEMLREML